MVSSSNFRDPENAAFEYMDEWHRVASKSSAVALRTLRSSETYERLSNSGALLRFEELSAAAARPILEAFAAAGGRPVPRDASVFSVETVDLISYPWEWPNSLLETAALLTLDIRESLLDLGLDLKDAVAYNVQFRGMRPVFMDLGSIEVWRPNPSWNAARQFIEHFINPLAVGLGAYVSAADAWELGRHRGLRSEAARQLLSRGLRRNLSLALLQAGTRPVEGNQTSESRYSAEAKANPALALNATKSLTRKLRKQIGNLRRGNHASTWVDYGARKHYVPADLERKSALVADFVTARADRNRLVLDVGGNDGFTAAHLVRHSNAQVVVMDYDAGALDVLHDKLAADPLLGAHVTPLLGDITALTPDSGLLGREFSGFIGRVVPSAVICQAVLHHVVVTQGVPMQFAIDALAAFNAPLQIEFATENDEKTRLLLHQIPNWSGLYSTECLLSALHSRFGNVELVGETSANRIVVNAESPRP